MEITILSEKCSGGKPKTECDYSKYIPIGEKFGKIYPKKSVDNRSTSSWLDIQHWYTSYLITKDAKDRKLIKTRSETAFEIKGRKICNSVSTCSVLNSEKHTYTPKRIEVAYLSEDTNDRFGDNEKYLMVASTNSQECMKTPIEVYIKLDKTQCSFLHVKTEMLVQCLKSFFGPFGDCRIYWASDLHLAIPKPTRDGLPDVFNLDILRQKIKDKISAVIYLSKEPGILLRHDNMCVLDTLSVSMGITKDELCIIPVY